MGGVFPRPSGSKQQIAAVLASEGADRFDRLRRPKSWPFEEVGTAKPAGLPALSLIEYPALRRRADKMLDAESSDRLVRIRHLPNAGRSVHSTKSPPDLWVLTLEPSPIMWTHLIGGKWLQIQELEQFLFVKIEPV
ncbi:hypothetical protein [Amorphus sp. 3PC139-8]|uniref:hypothetical protein n=1 Tax=Amorphus sp. 3PC139-8 TaxID=2735676 RepID=UPI00345DC9AC